MKRIVIYMTLLALLLSLPLALVACDNDNTRDGATTINGNEQPTEETPDAGGSNPDEGGSNPDEGGTNPDEGGTNPDEGGTSSDKPIELPFSPF